MERFDQVATRRRRQVERVGNVVELRLGGRHDLGVAVADGHDAGATETVDVDVAVHVLDRGPPAAPQRHRQTVRVRDGATLERRLPVEEFARSRAGRRDDDRRGVLEGKRPQIHGVPPRRAEYDISYCRPVNGRHPFPARFTMSVASRHALHQARVPSIVRALASPRAALAAALAMSSRLRSSPRRPRRRRRRPPAAQPSTREAATVPERALATITEQKLDARLRFLTNDLLEGRVVGHRGNQIAESFLASEFERLGLQGVNVSKDGPY